MDRNLTGNLVGNLASNLVDQTTLEKIEELASAAATNNGCKLYDLEFSGGRDGRILRVYIDKDGGASLDDCSLVSKAMNEALDQQDLVPGSEYYLEISSPGLERTLRKEWHFDVAVGKKIWAKLKQSLSAYGMQNKTYNPSKQVSEVLKAKEDSVLVFEVYGETVKIPLSEVEKANMVFEYGTEVKGKKKK